MKREIRLDLNDYCIYLIEKETRKCAKSRVKEVIHRAIYMLLLLVHRYLIVIRASKYVKNY